MKFSEGWYIISKLTTFWINELDFSPSPYAISYTILNSHILLDGEELKLGI